MLFIKQTQQCAHHPKHVKHVKRAKHTIAIGASTWKKAAALTAIMPMFLVGIPSMVHAAETSPIAQQATPETAVLALPFEGDLRDTSAAAHELTLNRGTITYGPSVNSELGQAAQFDHAALSLGNAQDLQPTNLSLSFWYKPKGAITGEQILMWDKAMYNNNGWYLSSASDTKPLVLSIGIGSDGDGKGQPLEFNMIGQRSKLLPADTWTHVMVTFDGTKRQAQFYINGIAQPLDMGNTGAQGEIHADSSTKYIGLNGAHNSGGMLNGSLDNVRLWPSLATTADVEREILLGKPDFSAQDLAQQAADALSLPASTTTNLTLPQTAANGSTIVWQSSDEATITPTGTVNRPQAGQPDAAVELSAVVAYGSAAVKRQFSVNVPASSAAETSSEGQYLQESGMDTVTVADTYLRNAADKEIDYLLSFNPDRLLVEFRRQSGLDTKGMKNYGGWEAGEFADTNENGATRPSRFTGHFVGHYLSAISEADKATFASQQEHAQLAAQQKALVQGIREAQLAYAQAHPENAGFLPAFDVNACGNTNPYNGLFVPFYNLHKVEQGLVDAYRFSNDDQVRSQAKAAAVDFAKWIVNWHNRTHKDLLTTEYGGMNDALYQVVEIADAADQETVLQAAHLFDEVSLFKVLASDVDNLNGKHANTTIPKLTGALRRYYFYSTHPQLKDKLSSTDQQELETVYKQAAIHFWQMVVDHHTYANGDNSQSEHFHEIDMLYHDATSHADPLQGGGYENNSTSETCNAHNMLKLTRMLLQVTRDAKYAEFYEHTFINAIVGSQNPETGMTTYFQPMKAGYPKVFGTEFGEFWCCQGTGIENFSKLNDSLYFTDANAVYVNMFRSSEFKDAQHHLLLTQQANVAKEDVVTFTAHDYGGVISQDTVIKLFVPTWAVQDRIALSVDGVDQSVKAVDEHGWLSVRVKDGTQIRYTLPPALRTVTAPDNANWVAFQYGPIVLAGVLRPTDPATNYNYGGILVRTAAYDPASNAMAQIFPVDAQGNSISSDEWLAHAAEYVVRTDTATDGGQLAFKLTHVSGEAANVQLQPYYSLYKNAYAMYWDMAQVDSPAYQNRIIAQKAQDRDNALTSDMLTSFDNQEQAESGSNNLHKAGSQAGVYQGNSYRHALADGWITYDMKLAADADKQYVGVRYNIADAGRTFDVYVDPTPLQDADSQNAGTLSSNAVKLKTVTISADADGNAVDNGLYWDSTELPREILDQARAAGSIGGASSSISSSSAGSGISIASRLAADTNADTDFVRVKFVANDQTAAATDAEYKIGGIYGVRISTVPAYSSDASLTSLSFDKGTLNPAYNAGLHTYTLTVPAETSQVQATFGVRDIGGYVRVNGIAIDDTAPRSVLLAGDVTRVDIASYAQDQKTVSYYSVQILKEGAQVPEQSAPVLEYTFDAADGAADTDVIHNSGTAGAALDGKIVGDVTLTQDDSAQDNEPRSVAQLTGGRAGSNAPYITIPAGLIADGQKDITIRAQVKWDGASNCIYPFNLGKDNANYLSYILACGGNSRVELSKSGAHTALTGQVAPTKEQWVDITAVLEGGKSVTYYLNGEQIATVTTTAIAADVRGTDAISGYLGKSFYNDPYFGGAIDTFQVWDRALSPAELFEVDKAIEQPSSEPENGSDSESDNSSSEQPGDNGNTGNTDNSGDSGNSDNDSNSGEASNNASNTGNAGSKGNSSGSSHGNTDTQSSNEPHELSATGVGVITFAVLSVLLLVIGIAIRIEIKNKEK